VRISQLTEVPRFVPLAYLAAEGVDQLDGDFIALVDVEATHRLSTQTAT
jgi:hypothetical protein